jgi:hypothetical protein
MQVRDLNDFDYDEFSKTNPGQKRFLKIFFNFLQNMLDKHYRTCFIYANVNLVSLLNISKSTYSILSK